MTFQPGDLIKVRVECQLWAALVERDVRRSALFPGDMLFIVTHHTLGAMLFVIGPNNTLGWVSRYYTNMVTT